MQNNVLMTQQVFEQRAKLLQEAVQKSDWKEAEKLYQEIKEYLADKTKDDDF